MKKKKIISIIIIIKNTIVIHIRKSQSSSTTVMHISVVRLFCKDLDFCNQKWVRACYDIKKKIFVISRQN